MKKSGVRRGVLVYKGPDPAGKMEIPVNKLGIPVLGEVDRTLESVGEAYINFNRDFLIDFGNSLDDLKKS